MTPGCHQNNPFDKTVVHCKVAPFSELVVTGMCLLCTSHLRAKEVASNRAQGLRVDHASFRAFLTLCHLFSLIAFCIQMIVLWPFCVAVKSLCSSTPPAHHARSQPCCLVPTLPITLLQHMPFFCIKVSEKSWTTKPQTLPWHNNQFTSAALPHQQ